MARPLLDALQAALDDGREYDLSSLFLRPAPRPLFSTASGEAARSAAQTGSSPTRSVRRRPASVAPESWPRASTTTVVRGSPLTIGPSCSTRYGNEGQARVRRAGVIAKKGNIPVGYYKDEKKTAETVQDLQRRAVTPFPGDYAEVEADGSVTMLGRGSVSINSGGEKIYPEEVEAALKGHPDVFDALVVGVPDPHDSEPRRRCRRSTQGSSPVAGRSGCVRAQGDCRLQGAAQPLDRRRGEALTGRQARLQVGQGTN